jgi:hypothetical protein
MMMVVMTMMVKRSHDGMMLCRLATARQLLFAWPPALEAQKLDAI